MTIVSEPPGASVSVNGFLIGAAPVDVPASLFEYYGDYDILLLADGYEPLLVRQAVPPPWYGYPFVDFYTENLTPVHYKDRRVFTYQLSPVRIVSPDELQKNADTARARGQAIGTPIQPSSEPPEPPPPTNGVPPVGARLGQPVPAK